MDNQLSKLKEQISKIEGLKRVDLWGPEFQLWEKGTKKLVFEIFGNDGLELFNGQRTMTTSYIDESFNVRQYQKELDNRKKILEGLLEDLEEATPQNSNDSNPINVLKKIWDKESALKENLLPTNEAKDLHNALLAHLDNILIGDSLPSLRYKKLKAGKPITWWSSNSGYPVDKPWEKFKPYLELLEQHEAEITIKNRFETEGLFVESRSQGEDQHLLIGKKGGKPEKAHIIIDGKTGEIRVEDNQQEPTEIISTIETILKLKNGRKIKTTREAIEEISEN